MDAIRGLLPILVLANAVSFAQSVGSTPAKIGSAAIIGRIVDDTNRPVIGAVVTLRSRQGLSMIPVRSSTNGGFVFRHLSAGEWTIGSVKAGYEGTGSGGRSTVVGLTDGQVVVDAVVRLRRFSTIAGTVSSEGGGPAVGVTVKAMRAQGRRWVFAQSAETDDRGEYRVHSLRPGRYLVFVPSVVTDNGVGPRAMPLPPITVNDRMFFYPLTFFPSARSEDDATPLVLEPGVARENVNIELRAVNGIGIEGRVVGGGGLPVSGLTVELESTQRPGWMSDVRVAIATTDRLGAFSFKLVEPGNYSAVVTKRIEAPKTASKDQGASEVIAAGLTLVANTPVHVESEPVRGLVVQLQRGLSLRGSVVFDGLTAPPTPGQLGRAQFFLMRATPGESLFLPANPSSDRSFVLPEMPPGQYFVHAVIPEPWTLRAAVYQGSDVADRPLDLTNASQSELLFIFTDKPARIQGVVRNVDGVGDDRATVVVFPSSRELWTDSRLVRRFRQIRTDRMGKYTVGGLPAGSYRVAALSDDRLEGWNERESLENLVRISGEVNVAEGVTLSVDLRTSTSPGGLTSTAQVWPDLAEGPREPQQDPTLMKGRISGKVTGLNTAEPLGGVTVRLSNDGIERAAYTDQGGVFDFPDLPSGPYRIQLSKPAYISSEYGAKAIGRPGVAVLVSPGKSVMIASTMIRGAVISGLVTDPNGNPLQGARVRVMSLIDRDSLQRLVMAVGAGPDNPVTDDRGMYRVYGLTPGPYLVGVTAGASGAGFEARFLTPTELEWMQNPVVDLSRTRQRSEDSGQEEPVTLTPTFYPSVTSAASATVVVVGPAEVRENIDVQTRLALASTIKGRLVMPDGGPADSGRVTASPDTLMMPSNDAGVGREGEGISRGGVVSAQVRADGSFSFAQMAPGRYLVTAVGRALGRSQGTAVSETSLTVAGTVHDFVVSLEPVAAVTGTVSLVKESGAFTPTDMRLKLIRRRQGPMPTLELISRLTENNRFEFTEVQPGSYFIEIDGLSDTYEIAEIRTKRGEILEGPVVLRAGDIVDGVQVILSPQLTGVSGTFVPPADTDVTGYWALLFSEDRRHWTEEPKRIFAVRMQSAGTFRFVGIAPGPYRLVFVSDVVDEEWRSPIFLETVLPDSVLVEVHRGRITPARSQGRVGSGFSWRLQSQ